MSKIILVSLLTRIKTILRSSECLIIAIPEILTSIEVMYSFAFSFFTIYVNVFLFDRLLWNHWGCFVCTCHVVSLEDAGCSISVITTSRSTRFSILLPLTLALHMKKLPPKTAVLRDCSWVVFADLHWAIFISWIDYYHLRKELRIWVPF